MGTKDQILQVLKKEFPLLKEKFGVRRIGLFGSYAKREETEGSDIDLLVEFERPIGFFKFIELENYLSEKLGFKVDLVTPDALKPRIKPYVLKEVIYV